MGIEEYKITSFKKPVSALADTPQMSADELKAWFDSNSVDELKTSVNAAIDAVSALEDGTAEIEAVLTGKVDKEAGKGLSANDYTDEEKEKLAGVETGANKYVHPATHSAEMVEETEEKRFVSNSEMAEISGKSHTHANKAALDGYTDAPADGNMYARKDGAWGDITQNIIRVIEPETYIDEDTHQIHETTDVDNFPNGITQVTYSEDTGVGGYWVFTEVDRNYDCGIQVKFGIGGFKSRSIYEGTWEEWS